MLRSVVILILVNICLAAANRLDYGNLRVPNKNNLPDSKLGIIGGKTTTIEKHPYEVSITLPYSFVAGAILNKNWILTTASGLNGINNDLQARVGSNSSDAGGTLYEIQNTIVHPKFDSYTFAYDLALHKLSKPLKFSKTVKSVKLGSKALKKGQKVVISGWGATEGVNGNPFKEITLTTIDFKTCASNYNSTGYPIVESQVCGTAQGNDGPFYDFGAPVVYKKKLYALYSWRILSYPSVCSKIYSGLSWIKKTIKT